MILGISLRHHLPDLVPVTRELSFKLLKSCILQISLFLGEDDAHLQTMTELVKPLKLPSSHLNAGREVDEMVQVPKFGNAQGSEPLKVDASEKLSVYWATERKPWT